MDLLILIVVGLCAGEVRRGSEERDKETSGEGKLGHS
jgi:hypothetical protein